MGRTLMNAKQSYGSAVAGRAFLLTSAMKIFEVALIIIK